MAYTKPLIKEERRKKRLRGERDQLKFIDLRFERWQVVGFEKARLIFSSSIDSYDHFSLI